MEKETIIKLGVFVLLLFTKNSFAQYTLTDSDVVVEENGIITSCSYNMELKELIIPAELDGQAVTGIGESVFYEKGITKVTFPNTLTYIGKSAFSFNNLDKVIIPDNVTKLGESAFYASQIDTVILGNGIDSVPKKAFSNNDIAFIEFGNEITYIGDYAFSVNRPYIQLTIPEKVTFLGVEAFASCGLSKITIPDNITHLGKYAFYANKIDSVKIGTGIDTIGYGAFRHNLLTSVTIPDNIKVISKYAFLDNELVHVDLGEGVSYIGRSAFYGNKIDTIAIPQSVHFIGASAFYFNNLRKIVLPVSLKQDSVFSHWNDTIKGNSIIKELEIDYTAHFTWESISLPTVTFLDWDGTQITQQAVEYGGSATAPQNPTRKGYNFIGWDADFSKVTTDIKVTALYEVSASLKTNSINDFKVFPNPFQNTLNIEISGYSSDTKVLIINMLGEVVFIEENIQEMISADLSVLNEGAYLIRVFSNGQDFKTKMILKH